MDTRLDWATATRQLGMLSGQIAQLHAQMVSMTARVIEDKTWACPEVKSVEHFLALQTGLDRSTIGKIVAIGKRVKELPEVVGMLADGKITLDQAAIVAKHAPAEYSADVAYVAQFITTTQLKRALSKYVFDTDTPAPELYRTGTSIQMGVTDERFRLSFTTTDLVAGAQVEQAIREAKDALFTAGNTEATLADGLVEVATRSLASVSEPSRAKRYQVLVHVDTDGQSWIHKSGALPKYLTEKYTCDGQLVPVWETEGTPVAVGRTQRIVPDRTRRLVEDRDKGCRFPDCTSKGYLEVHHMEHWRDGGATDPDNLLCLCSHHHDEHHRGSFTISGDPERVDGLIFKNHYGYSIHPPRPEPPPPGDGPPPQWDGPTGEHLDMRWLTFSKRRTPAAA